MTRALLSAACTTLGVANYFAAFLALSYGLHLQAFLAGLIAAGLFLVSYMEVSR